MQVLKQVWRQYGVIAALLATACLTNACNSSLDQDDLVIDGVRSVRRLPIARVLVT